jgi:hypothetical protein
MVVAAAPAVCGIIHALSKRHRGAGHPRVGANFDSRFVSREGAKNAKEKVCDGFSVPSLEKFSSATEFRPRCVLRVLRVRDIFAPFGECTHRGAGHPRVGANFDRGRGEGGAHRGFPQRRRVAETQDFFWKVITRFSFAFFAASREKNLLSKFTPN